MDRPVTNSAASQRRRATVGRLAKYFVARAIPGRPVFVAEAAGSGLRFYSHRQDVVGRHVAKYGAHEPVLTEWLGHHLDAGPPGLFVDVGAHIGWHALNAAMHEPVTKVVAFEPDPFNGSLLRRNIALNHADKIEVCPCAVGRAPGLARLHQYRATNFGAHSLAVDHGLGSTVVPVIDLDTALADLGFAEAPILAIKMDVEGYEPAVVAGAGRSLARAACVVAEFSRS